MTEWTQEAAVRIAEAQRLAAGSPTGLVLSNEQYANVDILRSQVILQQRGRKALLQMTKEHAELKDDLATVLEASDTLVAENRRLTKENADLKAQLKRKK